jgi:hypothetical protein
MNRAFNVLAQFVLEGSQDGAKVRELLFVHVFLTLLQGVGRELLFVQQIFSHCQDSVISENRLYKRNGGRLQVMVFRHGFFGLVIDR